MAVATIEKPTASLGSYQGTMTKRIIDMTPSEREAYYQNAAIKVRERLFSIGQPLVHEKNGQVIAEYANGKIEIIR
jgi:hypothetical protein